MITKERTSKQNTQNRTKKQGRQIASALKRTTECCQRTRKYYKKNGRQQTSKTKQKADRRASVLKRTTEHDTRSKNSITKERTANKQNKNKTRRTGKRTETNYRILHAY